MFDRRAFLKLAGMSSLAIAGSSFTAPLASARFDGTLVKTSRTRMMMGTFVNITVFDTSQTRGEEAVERAFDLIAGKEAVLTRFSDSSPVGALNKEGKLSELEPDVARMFHLSQHYYDLSRGAFDITVKPIIDVVRDSFTRYDRPPTETAIVEALRSVGMERLHLNDSSVSFGHERMGITLDGIAKGYIADLAAEFLRKQGIENILVNAGGDIRAIGGRENDEPWRIAVRDPDKQEGYACVVLVRDAAVATSGNYEVFFDKEKTFHHIVDPSTGHSPQADQSVTTFAGTATEADALSTAVFVMKPEQGIAFYDALPNVEGYIITREGRKVHSRGWKSIQA